MVRLRRVAVRVGLWAGMIYVAWCVAACAMVDTAIFPGAKFRPPAPGPPTVPGAVLTTHWLEPEPGVRVEAWLYLPAGATAASPMTTVVFAHGNGETIDLHGELVRGYVSRGVGVFMPEWRGYGRSTGEPSQAGIASDMRALRAWLIAQPGVDARRLVYHGRSLGGGVACELARTDPPAAMVLESTFTSVTALTGRMLVPPVLVRHPFRNREVLAEATWPLLLMHGTRDQAIPVTHARANRAAAVRSPKVLYQEFDSNHNDLPPPSERARYWALIDELIATVR